MMTINKKFIFLIYLGILPLIGFSQENRVTDSLNNLLSVKQDTTRLNVWSDLVFTYLKQKKVKEANSALNDALDYARNNNLYIPYKLHWAKAEVLFYTKEMEAAIVEMKAAIDKITGTGNKEVLVKAQNFLAYTYLYAGKFSECIDTYTKNIEFAKLNNLTSTLPESYSGLAYAYRTIGSMEEQRKQLILMADISLKEKNLKYAAEAYLRLGDIGMEADSNFVYAIQHYNECLKLQKQLNDSSSIAFTLLRLGWNHYLNKELDTALGYFFSSLEYSIPGNRLTSITNAYGNIGTIYRDKKEYDKAIKYYKASIEYSLKANDWYNLSWLYKDMSDMNKNLGNYKSAYENYVSHKRFSDSLEMSKFSTGLTDARTRYEAEKKEKDLEVLSLKLEKQKYFTYGFAGLIVLIVVIGLLLITQNKMNAKRKISEMNHHISEITQKNLRQQMNPHFIFNTLNSIQYYMYQHDKISTNNYLTKFSSLMRKTLENSQHTSIPIKDEIDALELYLQLESIRFKEKFDYKISIDDDIDTLLYKIPTMLIQPYVENAICHGLINKEDKGFLNIYLKLEKDSISCTIEDNGIGRDAAMEIKKAKNGNHQSLGTKITESRLNLVNALYGNSMKIEYTDIKDIEGKPNGTRVVIYIPIIT
jgi:tetratricopeptide (TPR) repeat protein